MRFDVLSLFPEIFTGYLGQSVLKLAVERGLVSVVPHNFRDWATGRHKQVDDRPFGGGPGMVLMVEPVVEAVEAVQRLPWGPAGEQQPGHLIMLTPSGSRLTQAKVEQLATHQRLVLLCGRYEGFDDRVRQLLEPEEISIGDYILGGGETAAMVLIDAVVRLVPGVLGDEQSAKQDSFSANHTGERPLEGAQYTRPREYRGLTVPDILLSGDHGQIAQWRAAEGAKRTASRRQQEQQQQ